MPRLGKYEGSGNAKLDEVTPQQKKGLHAAGITALIYMALIAVLFFMDRWPAKTENL